MISSRFDVQDGEIVDLDRRAIISPEEFNTIATQEDRDLVEEKLGGLGILESGSPSVLPEAPDETDPSAEEFPSSSPSKAPSPTGKKPTLEEFMVAAREDNPGMDDRILRQHWAKHYSDIDPKTLPPLDTFMETAREDNPNVSPSKLRKYWEEHYGDFGAARDTPPERDFMRGAETAVKQIPQLAYGLEAGAGAVGEKIFGEGGVATKIKEHGIKNYDEASKGIEKESRPSDSATTAWEMAKNGNPGALVDFLQYGLGYMAVQAGEMLATGGAGYMVGKLGAQGAAKLVAEKLIAKEAATLAAGKEVTDAITKQAVSNVAGKIGQTTALAGTAVGMEGGEIFGDLTSEAAKDGKSATGEQLAKALGYTLAAGGLEFVGDKLGFDLIMGKGPIAKMAKGATGLKGRAARGILQGGTGAVAEGSTEFGQTLLEQAGKDKDPFSEQSIREAVDAAALGSVGGTAIGTGSGVLRGPQAKEEKPPAPTVNDIMGAKDVDSAIGQMQAMVQRSADLETEENALLESRQPVEPLAPLAEPSRTRQPFDVPILKGPGEQAAPTIEPGLAFTPRTEPEADPREAIAAERARVLQGRKPASIEPETPVVAPAPGDMASSGATLQTAAEKAYTPGQLPTQESLSLRSRPVEKRPSQDPATVLEGGVTPEPSQIQPGTSFAPKMQPELTPKERLALERERLVRGRENKPSLPVEKQGVTPPVETVATQEAPSKPLESATDKGYASVEDLHTLAASKGLDIESGTFRELTKMVTGKAHLDNLTPQERETFSKSLQTVAGNAPAKPVAKPKAKAEPLDLTTGQTATEELPANEAAQLTRDQLVPQQNAEMLARAEKATADLEISGTERGGRYFSDTHGKGGDQEITGLKSATADWYKDATSGPQALSRKRVEVAVEKIRKNKGLDVGKDVQRIKGVLMLDREFMQSPFAPKSKEEWNALIAEATHQPTVTPSVTPTVEPEKRSPESVNADIDSLTSSVQKRMDERKDPSIAALYPAVVDNMTAEERDKLDALKRELPSMGEGRQAAQARVEQKRAERVKAAKPPAPQSPNYTALPEKTRKSFEAAWTGAESGDRPSFRALKEWLYPNNKTLRAEFERRSGTKLPKALGATNAAVEAYFTKKDETNAPVSETVPANSDTDQAAHEAAPSPKNDLPEPTEAQREAGNFQKGHLRIAGMDISIEHPAGSERTGTSKDGKAWSMVMHDHYGYIRGTQGKDKEHIDIYIKPGTTADYRGSVFVIDQNKPGTDQFDEHKVVFGVETGDEAKALYLANYQPGWDGFRSIKSFTMRDFKHWIENGDHQKPAGIVANKTENVSNTPAESLQSDSFSLTNPTETKPKAKGPEQLGFDIPAPTIGEKPIIGREVDTNTAETEAPLFSKAAQTELAEQTALPSDDSPTTILANALRTAADQIQGKPTIQDVGQKIGGARKDMAEKTGEARSSKPKDSTPGWRKRYSVSQIVGSKNPSEEGKWTIRDLKQEDFMGRPRQATRTLFDTKEEAEGRIPLLAVSRNHRTYKNSEGQWEIDRKIGDRKLVQVVKDTFPTEEAAMRYMIEHAEEIIETKTNFGEEILPRPETVRRVGADRRNGKNVVAEDFRKTFDFRAVEFGNWNNQEERQEVMNHAYDGLMDLAEVLDIPLKAIGLNGELALAFGARGHGLTGARAHYERDYGVINLTKMKGAGSLAHEWFHATDHYFGRQDGKTKSAKVTNTRGDQVYDVGTDRSKDYASYGFKRDNSGVREEVREAYTDLLNSMFTRAEQYVDDATKVEKFVGETREGVENKLKEIRDNGYNGLSKTLDPKYYKRGNQPASAEQLAAFDEIAKEILSGVFPAMQWKAGDAGKIRRNQMSGRWSNDSLDKISSIFKAVRGRSGFGSGDIKGPLDDLRAHMNVYSARLKMLAEAQAGTEKTKKISTEYAREAKSIDQGRNESYWMTNHEMAARAFEAYVEDKVKERGGQSDFLIYGTNSVVETPWGWKRPYPMGEERKTIDKGFDKLFGILQSKETDKGTALYRRSTPNQEELDAIEDLNEAIAEDLGMESGLEWSPAGDKNLMSAFTQVFDVDIVPVQLKNPKADSVLAVQHHGKLFVRTDAGDKTGFMQLAGHELLHQLRKDSPELYDWFSEQAEAYMREGAEFSYAKRLRAVGALLEQTDVREEILADFTGDALADPRFLDYLAQQNTSKFKQFVTRVLDWLTSVANKLTGGDLGSSIYFDEVDGLREKLAEVLNAYVSFSPDQLKTALGSDDTKFRRDLTGTIAVEEAKTQLTAAKASARPYLLGALGLQQIAEVYGREHKEVEAYNRALQTMQADFVQTTQTSDKILQDWDKLKIPVADQMAKVMEDARFANFDPDPVKAQAALNPTHEELRTRFRGLPEDAKAIYRAARDYYETLAQSRFDAMKERVQRAGGSVENRKRLIDRLELAYEKTKAKVYFPFTRFGEHIVVAKKMAPDRLSGKMKEADREVQAFSSPAEASKFATQMRARGWTVKQTTSKQYSLDRDGGASKAVREILDIVDNLGTQDSLPGIMSSRGQLKDAINQSFLNSLPDMSYAKHFIHAKEVKGASRDALRSFAHSALHGAHHISRIRYGDRLADAVQDLDTRINETEEGDVTEARQVYNELVQRHNAILNPNTHPFSAWLGQLGFTMSLGGVVATGFTNMTQVPLITLPWLGSRYGFGKSTAEIGKAYKDFLDPATLNKDSLFDASKSSRLTADERAMLEALAKRGRIDLTQTMDLSGRASQDNLSRVAKQTGSVQAKITQMLGFTFHAPEVANRQVTALATYRLARASGASEGDAISKAEQAIVQTHFIYESTNRARYMSGNVLRVLTMFKQYSQNIAYLYGRSAQVWLDKNNATKEERAIAKRQLLSMLGLQFAAAGTLGLPFVGTVASLFTAVLNAFGDDDDKKEWEVELRKFLAEQFGKEAGEVLSHGASRLTPWDMAGRLGQADLFFRAPQKEREGRAAAMDWLTSFAGPVLGYAVNSYLGVGDVVKGLKSGDAGHFMRGVEELTPSVIRHAVRTLRYEMEGGVKTRDGHTQLKLDYAEKLGQFFGFGPSRVAEMYEGGNAIKNKEHEITQARKGLLDHYYASIEDRDKDARRTALNEIREFNKKHPFMRITGDTLIRSGKARQNREQGTKGGVYLSKKREPLREQGNFANY